MTDLIYDVGAHRGEDSEFYLMLGYRVVAVEANPDLAAELREMFAAEIAAGDYTLVDKAIGEREGSVSFFVCRDKSVWGTADAEWAKRNAGNGAASERITVPCVRFADLVRLYGCPHYLKVDIEGADMLCIKDLAELDCAPRYVSVESTKTSWRALLAEFDALEANGYTRFKVVRQGNHRTGRYTATDGSSVAYQFELDSSGPFGEDVAGSWLPRWRAVLRYVPIFLLYKTIGDGSLVQRLTHRLPFGWVFNRIAGWYDTHATRGDG